MYEIYFAIYVMSALGLGVYASYKLRLWGTSPAEKLAVNRAEMDRVVSILSGVLCPFCREPSEILKTNFEIWTVQTVCRKCGQISFWKYMNGHWRRIAPFKYMPSPVNRVECAIRESEILGYNYIIEFPNAKCVELFKHRLSDLTLSVEDIVERKLILEFSCTQEFIGLDYLKNRGLIKMYTIQIIKRNVQTGEPMLVASTA